MVEIQDLVECPACGTDLSKERWSGGLCPACLIELALDDTALEAELEVELGEAPTLQFSAETFSEGEIQGERYRIRSLLGRGGMGEVWRAYDLKLRLDVALKALRKELITDSRALETLRQEVRVAREVISPNVCRVFDLEEIDGQELVSMEYVDGTTLQGVLKERGPLDLNEAREIASQFLAGLEAIHEAGLIHRDIKPENLMITRTGRVVVMDFGIAKGLGDGKTGTIAGTPAYMSPEQAKGGELDARADLFAAGVVLAEMVEPEGIASFEDRRRVWEGIHQESPEVAETPWSKVIAQAIATDRESRFSTASALARALEEVTLRAAGDESARPYPGLSAFQQEDAEFFYGRELEIEALWKKLRRPHLLAVIGPSGAGKSSFLRAGLLPTLTDGWSAIIATPGNRPFASLARALAEKLPTNPATMDALLRFEDPEVAVELISRWSEQHRRGLIILDQFEELFTQNPEEVQLAFAELLGHLPLEADVHVLLSMRDDFLFHCQAFESLAPLFSELTPLGPPTGPSLRRAIVQPALRCGYRFEDETIIEEMLSEVEGQRGALPLLAFAAAQLWERRDRDTGLLTRKSYDQIGGVGGALAQHAEAMLDYIGESNTPIVRELFRNLVTPQGTRASRDRQELLSVFPETEGEPFLEPSEVKPSPVPKPQRPAAKHVLNALIDARLLTSYEIPPDEEGGEPHRRVEIVHESLLGNWPRLVRWQTQDAQGAQFRDELRGQARLWEEHGRLEDYLWTGTAFKEYELWRERYPGGLTEVEEAFAKAMTSLAARRKRRRRIAVTVVIAALIVGLTVVGSFWRQAELETRRAEAGRLVALGEVEIESYPSAALAWATKSLEISDTLEGRLLALRALHKGPPLTALTSTEELGVSFGRWFSPSGERLASSTSEHISLHFNDGRESILLHDYATNRTAMPGLGFQSEDVLVADKEGEFRWISVPDGREIKRVEGNRGRLHWPSGEGYFSFVEDEGIVTIHWWPYGEGASRLVGSMPDWDSTDIDAGGTWMVYSRGNNAFLRSLEDWTRPPRPIGEHGAKVRGVALLSGGKRIATADFSPRITIWSSHGLLERSLRPPPKSVIQSLQFHPSGRWLAGYGGAEGRTTLVLWDLTAPADTEPIVLGRTDVRGRSTPKFHPSKPWVIAGHAGDISFWPLPSRYPWVVMEMTMFTSVHDLVFTQDDRWLVASGPVAPGLKAWPLEGQNNGVPRILLERPASPWSRLAAHPSGHLVAVKTWEGTVALVPLDGGPVRDLPDKIGGFGAFLDFSPSGRYLAGVPFYADPEKMVIRVWDLESGGVQVFGPVSGASSFLGIDDERQLHWSGSPNKEAGSGGSRVFDLEDGSVEIVAEETSEWFRAVSPDQDFMLVREDRPGGDVDLFWKSLESSETHRITSHGNPADLMDLTIDPSGRWMVSGGTDRIVRVGPVSGEEPHLLFGPQGDIRAVSFSNDGRWVASAGWGTALCIWPMPDMSQPPLHTLPLDELITKLHAATNLRVVVDPESPKGWKVEKGPFPGWAEVPEW